MKSNRIIAIFLIMIMLLLTLPIEANSTRTKFAQSFYDLMQKIDILREDEDLSEQITRERFAEIICKIANLEADVPVKNFNDVSEEFAKYIYGVSGTQIMNGISENSFGSEKIIDFNQAVTAIINLLGYKEIAMNNGGYPNGYLVTASQLSLIKGVDTKAFSLCDAIMLLYNACDVDLRCITKIDNGNAIYRVIENKTLLSAYHDIYRGSGIVTRNSIESLSDDAPLQNGKIEIGGVEYYYDGNEQCDILGCAVDFYYSEEEVGKTIQVIKKHTSKNKEYNLNANDFMYYGGNFIEFADGNKKIRYTLSEHKVLLNNQLVSPVSNETFKINIGNIRLIDNNNDGQIEVISITKVETSVIAGIDPVDFAIYFDVDYSKYSRTKVNVNEKDENTFFEFLIMDDGNLTEAEIDELKKGMVSSLIASENEKYVKIIATTKEYVGTVSEKYDDKLTIDGKEYTYLEKEDTAEILPGEKYKYMLDYYGNVVSIKGMNTGVFYAWLYGGILEGNLEKVLQLKMMTASGEAIYECAENVYLDGKRVALKNKDNIPSYLMKSENEVVPQLLKVVLDNNDKIASIDTIYDSNPESDINNLVLEKSGSFQYNQRMKSFTDVYKIENTFGLFTLDKPAQSVSESDFKIAGALKHEQNYKAELYDVSDAGEIGAMIIKSTADVNGGSLMGTHPLGVFVEAFKGMNSEGIVANGIKVFIGGEVKAFFFEPTKYGYNYSQSFNFGDIVRLSVNGKNEITDYAVEFNTTTKNVRTNKINNSFMLYGALYAKGSSNFAIINGNNVNGENIDLTKRKVVPSQGGNYYAIDMDKKFVFKTNYSALPDGLAKNPDSKFYVFTETEYYGTLVNVFLYLGGE